MKKAMYYLLILFFGGLLAFSGWKVVSILSTYQQGADSYENLEQYIQIPTQPQVLEPETVPAETANWADSILWPQVDFEALARVNPDIVGWIVIEGTNINYPIVQGRDNSYYLNHLFDGTRNAAGCIFMDAACRGDFTDVHSIIYGHHMKNKTMFAGLMAYKDQSFYEEHATAFLLTPAGTYQIRFFSGYVANNQSDGWERDFYHERDFENWISDLVSRSCFQAQWTPGEDERIITLSTCTYEFDSAKFLLHGYLEKAQ